MPEPTATELGGAADAAAPVETTEGAAPVKFALDDDEARELAEVHARVHEGYELLKRIAAKMGIDDKEEMREDDDEEEVKVTESVEAPVEQSAAFAAIQGKVNALEARERKRKDEEERDAVVESAMVTLAAWNPDDKTRESLIHLVASSRSPTETASTFVASFKATVPMRPAGTLEEFDARLGAADDPVVIKFAQQGPDALASAREASAQYDELDSRGLLLASSREDFIATQMSARPGGELSITRR
jgi:hypothetical protein